LDNLEEWGRLWYPDNWVHSPILIAIFIIGIVSAILGGLIVFSGFLRGKKYRLLVAVVTLVLFIWALPVIVDTVIGLFLFALGLALIAVVGFAIFGALTEEEKEHHEEIDGKKYDSETGDRIIKQNGKTYRQNWSGNWEADKDELGRDKVERDWKGDPVIEKDWKGDQKIERDLKGDPEVPLHKKK
jgi:hypothetical protein